MQKLLLARLRLSQPILYPSRGKRPVSLDGRDNSGRFSPQPPLSCPRSEKANYYQPTHRKAPPGSFRACAAERRRKLAGGKHRDRQAHARRPRMPRNADAPRRGAGCSRLIPSHHSGVRTPDAPCPGASLRRAGTPPHRQSLSGSHGHRPWVHAH